MYTYDRDIILLPKAFKDERGLVKVPRGQTCRESLAVNGLIGKICLTSEMTEEEIFDEIRSVFCTAMSQDLTFPTASAVAGKNAKAPVYILAGANLQVNT